MKRIAIIVTALILTLLTAAVMPAQVFADSVSEYISEVKIGMGENAEKALESLKGYIILKDENGNPVDLNQDAGGGWGSKGDKAVLMGYKTTTKRSEAITDLALMNMKGGYSAAAYDALMEGQMKSQIIPFVDNFLVAIKEYRANYNSSNEENKARARYIHDLLNKFTDDDCSDRGLGDLLLNETKYEMGLSEYNLLSVSDKKGTDAVELSTKKYSALPKKEKRKHTDILTILAQGNGNAILLIERLIVKATDTEDDSWVDRFTSITYEDLIDAMDMLPTDAEKELALMYQDDAKKILALWETFREQLLKAGEAEEDIEKFEILSDEDKEILENFDITTADEKQLDAYARITAEAELNGEAFANSLTDIIVKEYLENVGYGDGTLFDFFTQPYEDIEEDITKLYPLVASLSDGQRAGLDFVSLSDLVVIAGTISDAYEDEVMEEIDEISVYDGVNRDLYQKGGVAMTSDAIRAEFAQKDLNSDNPSAFPLNWWTLLSISATIASAAGLGISLSVYMGLVNKYREFQAMANAIRADIEVTKWCCEKAGYAMVSEIGKTMSSQEYMNLQDYLIDLRSNYIRTMGNKARQYEGRVARIAEQGKLCRYLSIGFSIAMVALAALSTYLTYQDLVNYYKVEFTPIPKYMVEEKDITAYNEKGEKIVIKNLSAYYTAVECNRQESAEYYGTSGIFADMNGDVGKQWLALYAQKSQSFAPILADTLLVKVDDTDVPPGYTTGVHLFGSGSAFNLNSGLYDWNNDAPSVMIYFKTEGGSSAPDTAASNFSTGTLAAAGSCGIVAGAVISAFVTKAARKKKREAAAA